MILEDQLLTESRNAGSASIDTLMLWRLSG